MPYYHVALAKKEGKNRVAFQFDMTKEQVEREITNSLSKQQPFMVGKFYIQPNDVETIKISETKDRAKQVLQNTKSKRLLQKTATRFFGIEIGTDERYIDELSIINSGKDVTRDFVTQTAQASDKTPIGKLTEKNTERVEAEKSSEVPLGLETPSHEGEEWEKLQQKIAGLQGDIAPFKIEFIDRDTFKQLCDRLALISKATGRYA